MNPHNTIFVGNMPFSVEDWEIEDHFMKFGQVKSLRMPLDNAGKKQRGSCHIEFVSHECAAKAIEETHTKDFAGRPITVKWNKWT